MSVCKIVTTSNCQLHCNGCSASKWMKENPNYDMSIEQVFNFIESCKVSGYKFEKIIISGGEPTLWPNLIEAIKMLKLADIGRIEVWTNAVEIDIVRSLNGLADVRVSAHARNKEYHDELRSLDYVKLKEKEIFYKRPKEAVEGSLPANCLCPHITITGDWAYPCANMNWLLSDVPDKYKTKIASNFIDRLMPIDELINEPICMCCESNIKLRNSGVSSQPTIAVCTSCYNYGPYIADWAMGILDQTRKPDMVCFFNNGSTDITNISAQQWGRKFEDVGIEFRYEESDKIHNSIARNKCIDMCDTEWAMHLDTDDILMPHALDDWEALALDADVVQFGLEGFPKEEWYRHRPYKHIQLYESCAAAGASSPFRMSMFPRYREELPSSCDTFLWVDYAKKGARFVPTKRPCYRYRVHSDSMFHSKSQELRAMLKAKSENELKAAGIPLFHRHDEGTHCVVRPEHSEMSASCNDGVIVYSAHFDGPEQYDILQYPQIDVPHICFMDIPQPMKMSGWECVPQKYHDKNPRKRARHHKAMSHILFPNKETIWVDSCVLPLKLVTSDKDIMANPHPHGLNCAYAEGNRCINDRRTHVHVSPDKIQSQLDRYKNEGLPEGYGSPETGLLYRKSNDKVKLFNEIWWKELEDVLRDQVSFAYAKWRSGVTTGLFSKQIRQNPSISKQSHYPKIYTFSPSDRRGIGFAYNSVCKIVPNNECWICLTDLDIMCLPATFNFQLEDVIKKHGDKYDMFTCYATRLFTDSRCLNGKRSEERDLVKLRNMVLKPYHEKYAQVTPINTFTGYLMLFKRGLWEEIPFPLTDITGKTTVLGIDTEWARLLKNKNKRIGMMEGVAVIHYYRLGEEDSNHRRYLEDASSIKTDNGSPIDVGVSEMEPTNKDIIIWQLCRQAKSSKDLVKRARSMHIQLEHDTDGRIWYIRQSGDTVEIKASPTIAHPNCLMAKQ